MLRPLVVLAGFLALALSACGGDETAPSTTPSPAPTASATPQVNAEDACPSAVVLDKIRGDGPEPLYWGWEDGETICWLDTASEAAFRVQGSVTYWLPPPTWKCDETLAPRTPVLDLVTSPGLEPDFLRDLPANTTRFPLPRHPDSRMGIKDYSIRIEALDSNGHIIAFGGSSVTRDAFCE